MTAMGNWYLGVDGTQSGPFSKFEVLAKLEAGEIKNSALAWKSGMADWQPISELPEFSEAAGKVVELATRAVSTESVDSADNYGGFWLRVLACVLDSVVIAVLIMISALVSGSLVGILETDEQRAKEVLQLAGFLISVGVNFIYYGVIQALFEGTPGKYACGLRLVRNDFAPVSVWTGMLRYICRAVVMLPLGLGIFAIGWHPKKRGWHDRLAGTVVVEKDFLAQMRAPSSVVHAQFGRAPEKARDERDAA